MKRFERKLSADKKKLLREELLWMRIHNLFIRPAISIMAEYFR